MTSPPSIWASSGKLMRLFLSTLDQTCSIALISLLRSGNIFEIIILSSITNAISLENI